MPLYALADLNQPQPDLACLTEIAEWVHHVLAKPHPNLGRSGPVCPFVPYALQHDTLRLAVIRTQTMGPSQIEAIVRCYRDQFLELEPQSGELVFYKAIMLIFPDVLPEQAPELIDAVQQKLKPFFVEQGLMIGEFHQHNETPGLHNPDFRPLRSPIPMLAIRFMAESDLPFLERMSDHPQLRVQYLQAYLERMGSIIKDEAKLSHAQNALALAQAQLAQGHSAPPLAPDHPIAPNVSRCPFAHVEQPFG